MLKEQILDFRRQWDKRLPFGLHYKILVFIPPEMMPVIGMGQEFIPNIMGEEDWVCRFAGAEIYPCHVLKTPRFVIEFQNE